jgi:hypothetical protein
MLPRINFLTFRKSVVNFEIIVISFIIFYYVMSYNISIVIITALKTSNVGGKKSKGI